MLRTAAHDRRGGDSNPRYSHPHTGFRNQPLQPLGHLSVKAFGAIVFGESRTLGSAPYSLVPDATRFPLSVEVTPPAGRLRHVSQALDDDGAIDASDVRR